MRFGWSAKKTSVRIRGVAKIAALIFTAIYIAVYLAGPFPGVWNDIFINLWLVIAACFTAAVATMIWTRYEQTETPRQIWRYFAIGLWSWVAAEISWGYLYIVQGDVPIGIPDVFWVAAYVFFAHSFARQYHILAQPSRKEMLTRISIAILALLVLYLFVYRLLASEVDAQSGWDAVVNSFYPVADIFLALIALWFVRHFGGGAFSRPWLGLIAFSFTDLLYAWIEISGIYDQANLWTALFDTTYLAAYLILGLGLLSQWVFLKYGLSAPTQPQ